MVTSHYQLNTTGRDRLVVRTLRCGRSNPGSNPGHGIFFSSQIAKRRLQPETVSVGRHKLESLSINKQGPYISFQLLVSELPRTGNGHHKAFKLTAHDYSIGEKIKTDASAGNRTRINCLEGSYADHYTTDAFLGDEGLFSLYTHTGKVTQLAIQVGQITCASIAQWQSVGLVNPRS